MMLPHWVALPLAIGLAATPSTAQLSLDGGIGSGIGGGGGVHRGAGTGVVAPAPEDGVFAGLGLLMVQVAGGTEAVSTPFRVMDGLELVPRPDGGLSSARPQVLDGVALNRDVARLPGRTVRWVDSFTNVTGSVRTLSVIWGGQAAAAARFEPAAGPSPVDRLSGEKEQVAILKGGPRARVVADRVDFELLPDVRAYPGPDPSFIGYRYSFTLQPGQTRRLLHAMIASAPGSRAVGREAVQRANLAVAGSGLRDRERAQLLNWSFPGQREDDGLDLASATLEQIRAAVLDGRMTVREVAEIYRARIAAMDRDAPGAFARKAFTLGAFTSLNPQLLAQADALDLAWQSRPDAYPLLGAIVAVKDNIMVAGLPMTIGVPALSSIVPAQDAAVVAQLRRLGALVIGKTNLDELATNVFGLSGAGGQTRNLFAPDRSPGGSSAGSATAVAARLASFALGTDTCDSILQPSAQAALIGLRPTVGLLPTHGVLPGFVDHDVVGPMTASMADARLVMSHLTPGLDGQAPATLEGRRIGRLVLPAVPGDRLSAPPTQAALSMAAAAGAVIVDVAFDPEALNAETTDTLLLADWPYLQKHFVAGLPGSTPAILQALDDGTALMRGPRGPQDFYLEHRGKAPNSESDRRRHQAQLARYRQVLDDLFRKHRIEVLAMPTVRGAPSLLGLGLAAPGFCELSAWSGRPAITLPSGRLAGTPWPSGLMLLGKAGADADLLGIAAGLAALLPPPPRAASMP